MFVTSVMDAYINRSSCSIDIELEKLGIEPELQLLNHSNWMLVQQTLDFIEEEK